MVLERRRRFAGEGFGMGGDQAAALREATEQLKAAQEALKQQQAAGSGAAAVTAAPTAATTDIGSLRKQLGIDDLISSVGKLQTQRSEMPQFEMPQFEMPQFEQPDWSSMMPDFGSLLEQYLPQQGAANEPTTQQPSVDGPGMQKKPGQRKGGDKQKPSNQQGKAGTKIKIGGQKYDLSTTGGAGLGLADIKNLQNQGLGKKQIQRAANKTKQAGLTVSKQAQQFLNQLKPAKAQPSATAKTQAKTITTAARRTIAAAAKPAARPAPRPAAKPAARPAPRPAARPAARRK